MCVCIGGGGVGGRGLQVRVAEGLAGHKSSFVAEVNECFVNVS